MHYTDYVHHATHNVRVRVRTRAYESALVMRCYARDAVAAAATEAECLTRIASVPTTRRRARIMHRGIAAAVSALPINTYLWVKMR